MGSVRQTLFSALFGALLVLSGCEGSFQETAPLSSVDDAEIFGGGEVLPGSPIARFMVALTFKGPQGNLKICSGVLVARNVVLTAAHCIARDLSTEKIYFAVDLRNPQALSPSLIRNAVAAIFPEEYPEARQRAGAPNSYDLALIKMDRPAPLEARTIPIADRYLSAEKAPLPFVAGFGVESYDVGTNEEYGVNTLKATWVERQESGFEGIIQLNQTLGRGICIGDSGGPAYVVEKSGYKLIGVATSVNNYESDQACRGFSNYVSVSHWSAWLKTRIAEFTRN
jgi:secreted trypsin-like serine protease